MTTKESYSVSERRKTEHLRLLKEFEQLNFAESCCDICRCDCLSSHRSDDFIHDDTFAATSLKVSQWSLLPCDTNNNNTSKNKNNNVHTSSIANSKRKSSKTKAKAKVKKKSDCLQQQAEKVSKLGQSCGRTNESTLSLNVQAKKEKPLRRRSKSAGSLRSRTPTNRTPTNPTKYTTRDCKILQDLLGSLQPTPRLEITSTNNHINNNTVTSQKPMYASSKTLPHAKTYKDSTLGSLKLCESMANLCLAPTVREAFQQVPIHDKKILNRMASKRCEKAIAKENAWLARKYWENERYERELFKCEQMEEYKRAVRDKQFQDYLLTKERLNVIAQRDMAELKRLKDSLHAKEVRTKKRLDALRMDRDMQMCQRRCDELRKTEAVTIQQEEHQLDNVLRKHDICQRLTERLQRADQIRTQMLDGYLKRLRYDNYLEQLVHDEHWRETQEFEQIKREQLKQQISRKRSQSQRFVANRQQQNAALSNMAKISASLREIVRSSVTPESGNPMISNYSSMPALSKILIDRPLEVNKKYK